MLKTGKSRTITLLLLAILLAIIGICKFGGSNPWPRKIVNSNTMFCCFAGEIKSLDPAVCYYEHEATILDNIVEMPLEYHYLKRPYQLVPMLLETLPTPIYKDQKGQILEGDPPASQIASVEYLCKIRRGIRYQPHPCFSSNTVVPAAATSPWAFSSMETRELKAIDFKVALVRICDPSISSPVYSTLCSFLQGMDLCSQALSGISGQPDYRTVPFSGCQIDDDYTFRLVLKRKYPQVLYWMAMHFFAPIPYEAVAFYRRPEIQKLGLGFHNWPVGTGAYLLKENRPNDQLVLEKNPNYRGTPFPAEGMEGDDLTDAGKMSPFIDRILFFYERETVPGWIKFLQGYYDISGIPSDAYDHATALSPDGSLGLSEKMKKKGITMQSSPRLVSYYFGFNMLDPVYGGLSPQKCMLRRALSMVLDTQELIEIFMNGRGFASHGILPPGLVGGEIGPENFNRFLFRWNAAEKKPIRRSLDEAKRLLAEAGYPNGISPDGKRLVLKYDHSAAGEPGFKSIFQFYQKQFNLLGIDLVDNGTDLNRYRDKISTGNFQFASKGWVADYPDPENFLCLFYSKNGHVATGGRGANYTNYSSPEFDALFEQLETMAPSPERIKLILQAQDVLRRDAPCIWFMHSESFTLIQPWLKNYRPHEVGQTFLRFRRIDVEQRKKAR